MVWPDSCDYYAIDPARPWEQKPDRPSVGGHAILSSSQPGFLSRILLLSGLELGSLSDPLIRANCFNPRHALVLRQGERTYEVLICFECLQIFIDEDGLQLAHLGTSPLPAPIFNALLP
jgi:hypothetical protein